MPRSISHIGLRAKAWKMSLSSWGGAGRTCLVWPWVGRATLVLVVLMVLVLWATREGWGFGQDIVLTLWVILPWGTQGVPCLHQSGLPCSSFYTHMCTQLHQKTDITPATWTTFLFPWIAFMHGFKVQNTNQVCPKSTEHDKQWCHPRGRKRAPTQEVATHNTTVKQNQKQPPQHHPNVSQCEIPLRSSSVYSLSNGLLSSL